MGSRLTLISNTMVAKQKEEKTEEKVKKVSQLKTVYDDFKVTMGAIFGDFEETIGKHKFLLLLSFLAFLFYKNRELTVDHFVKRVEKKLLGDGFIE